MAESKDDSKDEQSDNFADDLDAMLNDVDTSMDDKEELINDDDAIDRLIMDDDLVSSDEITSTEAEQSNIENEAIEDEFSEDDLVDEKEPEKEIKTELEIESNDDSNEMDEFAEIDALSDDGKNDLVEDEVVENTPETETETETDADFLMADFDISSDDDLEIDELSESEENEEQSSEVVDEVDAVLQNESANENNSGVDVSAEVQKETDKLKLDIDQLREQVSNLVADNDDLNQQLAVIVADISKPKDDAIATDIDALQSEQRKLRKNIKESDAKVPVITYIALGVAILALLVGGGLGAIGYGAKSDTETLAELVTTIEEEVEIISAKDPTADVKKINDKLSLLAAKDDHLNKQLARLEKLIIKKETNPLKPVVDDLVEQNDHAQQAIELLLAKVDTLEQGKVRPSRKTKSKKIIPKVKWVVNLVSFKQDWYAKRKAEEFEKKGIFSKVIQVKVKGEKWFRLTVEGFKSKYEAAAYAVKAKKALNLISVWVTKA